MGIFVFIGIVVVSLAVGIAAQVMFGRNRLTWLIVAVTGTFGAYFASETFPGSTVFEAIKDWGPQVDGFYVIPGIITGALIALVAYLGTRNLETRAIAAA